MIYFFYFFKKYKFIISYLYFIFSVFLNGFVLILIKNLLSDFFINKNKILLEINESKKQAIIHTFNDKFIRMVLDKKIRKNQDVIFIKSEISHLKNLLANKKDNFESRLHSLNDILDNNFRKFIVKDEVGENVKFI